MNSPNDEKKNCTPLEIVREDIHESSPKVRKFTDVVMIDEN